MMRMLRLTCAGALLALMLVMTAQAQNDECVDRFRERQVELRELLQEARTAGLSERFEQRLLQWRRAFRADVQQTGLTDVAVSAATSVGSSYVVAFFAGGGVTLAPTSVGIIISALWESGANAYRAAAAWPIIDANTAIFEWVLDHVENGHSSAIDSRHLRRFVQDNSSFLEGITGERPPCANCAELRQYLERNSHLILAALGNLEEQLGARAFPRYRFPRELGIRRHNRRGLGYYRHALAARVIQELRRIDTVLERLKEAECGEGTAAAATEDASPAEGTSTEDAPSRIYRGSARIEDGSRCLADRYDIAMEVFSSSFEALVTRVGGSRNGSTFTMAGGVDDNGRFQATQLGGVSSSSYEGVVSEEEGVVGRAGGGGCWWTFQLQ